MSTVDRIKLKKDVTKKQLVDYGFIYVYPDTYKLRIPAYKYKNKLPLIFLEFTIKFDKYKGIQEENEYIYISCTNRDGTFYRPFYDKDYAVENDVLKKIKLTLNKTISDLNKNNITTTKVRKKKKAIGDK